MLCDYFLPHIGGVEIHVDEVTKALVHKGHDVTVQCQTAGGSNYPYKIIRTLGENPYLPRNKYDVIHCHDWFTYNKDLWKYAPKVYMTFHGWEGHCPPSQGIVIERQRINGEVSGSIIVGKYIESWYGTKGSLIWGGYNPDTDIDPEVVDKEGFLFVGQLRPDLELDKYIRLLSQLGANPKLDIVGEGDIKHFHNLCDELGIDVRFYGGTRDFRAIRAKVKYVLGGGYLSQIEALVNGKIVIQLYSNDLKRDYVELFPPKIISGPWEQEGQKLAEKVQEGLSEEVILANQKWARAQTWESVSGVYESLWGL